MRFVAKNRVTDVIVVRNLYFIKENNIFQLGGVSNDSAFADDGVSADKSTLADLRAFSDNAWAVDGSGRCDTGIFCDPDIFAAFFVFCRIKRFAEFKNKVLDERKHFPWIRFAFKDFCGNGLG